MIGIRACSTCLFLMIAAASTRASMISATITADNHYALYVGNGAGTMVTLIGGNELGAGGAPGTYNWSLPEGYGFATDLDHLYIAAWSDDHVAQGLLAELLIDGDSLFSGDTDRWEVYATGIDKDDGAAYPTIAELGTQIGIANAGTGGPGTSVGWTSIVPGGLNGVGPWGTVPGISGAASWMWWGVGEGSPFAPGGDFDEYLIFRTSLQPVPLPGAALLGILGLGTVAWFKKRFNNPVEG